MPSLLAADFGRLASAARAAERGGADWLQVDVMDGRFVPNLSFGAEAAGVVARSTKIPADCHLMTVSPEERLEEFARAGAKVFTFHLEAVSPAGAIRLSKKIRQRRMLAGLAIKPQTPVERMLPLLPHFQVALVMTVEPGFGGQKLIPRTLSKIRRVREYLDARGLRAYLQCDGGIDEKTAPLVARAGARALVAGTSVFRNPLGISRAISRLRRAAEAVSSGAARKFQKNFKIIS